MNTFFIIDTTCGIYDTSARVVFHRNGTASVSAPYIKWGNNCGNLAFKKVKISNLKHVAILKDIIDDSEPAMSYGELISNYI